MINKIGIFLSIFSHDDIENSISYITCLCLNIKKFNALKITYSNIDLIINTDSFTQKIIFDLCRQEKIDTNNVIFHVHRRNCGLRGMFWRLESFFADEYDISVNAEGDYDISLYFKDIEYFEKNNFDLMIYATRQIEIDPNAIANSKIYIRPKNISVEVKNKIKNALELFDHIDDIDYGVDEYYVMSLLKKYFYDKYINIIINDTLKIRNNIKDTKKETISLKKIFNSANVITIRDYNTITKDLNFYKLDNIPGNLDYYIRTNTGKLCYCIYGKCLRIKNPFRISFSEFCQKRLIKLIYNII